MFLLHFLLFLGYPVVPIFIIGLLYWSNFITPDVHNLVYSTIRIIFLIYFFSWVAIADQSLIYFLILLVSYTRPISYLSIYFLGLLYWSNPYFFYVFNLGLVYCTMLLGDFWKTCPARCSLALCHGYLRPLPPPLWGSFAARFFFFLLLIFLFIFLLSSYTEKST